MEENEHTEAYETKLKLGPHDLVVEVTYRIYDKNGEVLERCGLASFPNILNPGNQSPAVGRVRAYLEPNLNTILGDISEMAEARFKESLPKDENGEPIRPSQIQRVEMDAFNIGGRTPKSSTEQKGHQWPSVDLGGEDAPPLQATG